MVFVLIIFAAASIGGGLAVVIYVIGGPLFVVAMSCALMLFVTAILLSLMIAVVGPAQTDRDTKEGPEWERDSGAIQSTRA